MPSHEECCWRVCLLCMNKGKEMRPITNDVWKTINEFLVEGLNSEELPKVICGTCRKVTSEYRRGVYTRKIDIFDYSQMNLPKERSTRSGIVTCSCYICKVATSIPKNISAGSIAMAQPERIPVGRPSKKLDETITEIPIKTAIKVCTTCFSIIARGCTHNCNKKMCASNLRDITDDFGTPKCKEKLTAQIITDQFAASGSSTISLSRSAGLSISIKRAESKPVSRCLFTLADMSTIQTDLDMSNNQIIKLATHMRTATANRKLIEPSLKKSLELRNHQLNDLYSLSDDQFLISDENDSQIILERRPFIYCNNVKALIDTVQLERNKTYSNAKIGIDGGSNTLKVCLTLYNLDDGNETSSHTRQSYEDGVAAKQTKLDTGVKKLFIIGLVSNVPENYRNLLTLWIRLDIDSIVQPYTISADLKLINIVCGLMTCASNHPCPWCNIHKKDMHECLSGDMRTFQSLTDSFWVWYNSGSVKSSAKHFGNVTHLPLLNRHPKDTLILDVIPPPELHLLIGPVSGMYKALKGVWPEADKWLKLCNASEEHYHGGTFNGNNARKILKNVKLLIDPLHCNHTEFINAFNDFDKVVHACYGRKLQDDYEVRINNFRDSYLNLGLPITPKVHTIIFHIKEFCNRHQTGLGIWSEQASESVHDDFNKTWSKYAVYETNQRYGEQMLRAVVSYAGKHL